MAKILSTLAILFLLFASSFQTKNAGWTKQEQKGYMEGCIENASKSSSDTALVKSYCSCTLEKLMKKYNTMADMPGDAETIIKDAGVQQCIDEARTKMTGK